jgi:hypothetical protein
MNTYKISVKLFVGTLENDSYEFHHADIVEQLSQIDYYYNQIAVGDDDNVSREIDYAASELLKKHMTLPPTKKLGKYIQDNNLEYDYALNIVNTLTHFSDISHIEYNFNPLTCILTVFVNSSYNREQITQMLIEDSLKDEFFEGFMEVGKGYDYYQPIMYTDNNYKSHTLYRYMGTIDYRKQVTIHIEKQ